MLNTASSRVVDRGLKRMNLKSLSFDVSTQRTTTLNNQCTEELKAKKQRYAL